MENHKDKHPSTMNNKEEVINLEEGLDANTTAKAQHMEKANNIEDNSRQQLDSRGTVLISLPQREWVLLSRTNPPSPLYMYNQLVPYPFPPPPCV